METKYYVDHEKLRKVVEILRDVRDGKGGHDAIDRLFAIAKENFVVGEDGKQLDMNDVFYVLDYIRAVVYFADGDGICGTLERIGFEVVPRLG